MNWSIEQNYILLKFVRVYGENEWSKHANELRDMFMVYLSHTTDMDINNFNEEDFRRQYNYILATTRQECLKQGVKLIKSGELTEIALKKFHSYLELQQQNKEDGVQMEERMLRLLEEGDLNTIGQDKIFEMREKIFRVVGYDLMGIAFNLGHMENNIQRDACLNEMAQSWVRKLSDGRVCVAGDTDVLPEKLLIQLYEASRMSDHNPDSDSDATDTLEEHMPQISTKVLSYQDALLAAGLSYKSPILEPKNGFAKLYGNKKVIAGWDLTGKEDRAELDERLHAWEESVNRSGIDLDFNTENSLSPSTFVHQISDQQRIVSRHCSPPSSASTQEAFVSRLVFAAADSNEITTGSPSADTALSHATVDDLDEPISLKDHPVVKKKRKARQSLSTSSAKKVTEKGGGGGSASGSVNNINNNKESENKKRIMRNITKMIIDHPYSSIFMRSIREDTGIYKHATLNINKISHDVIDGDFQSYEHFIEVIILFFLQMKIYYLGDKETVKKIESVYADVSKQLVIIYPDLNDTVPLSDLFQRRQKRFKGNYA